MSLYSDACQRLARDAKRASALSTLAPYREDLVKDIVTESRHLTTHLQSLYQSLSQKQKSTALSVAASVHENALRQNKRVLLAYARARFQRLQFILWSLGIGSASIALPDFVSRHLSPPELQLKKTYGQLLSRYRAHLGDLDLSESVPPKDVYVEVRVLKECGQVVTEEGVVRLSMGSMHHLKRSQVESLIRAGYLLHVG